MAPHEPVLPPRLPKRRSMRLRHFDYGSIGAYFVTVVAQGRQCLFGGVVQGTLRLNAAGRMLDDTLRELPLRFPGATLDEAIVMPNHVHLLLSLRQDALGHGTTLGSVVGAWKSLTTRAYKIGAACGEFAPISAMLWQRGYYDHVVRDADDYDRIRWYIRTNPDRWCVDRENPRPGP